MYAAISTVGEVGELEQGPTAAAPETKQRGRRWAKMAASLASLAIIPGLLGAIAAPQEAHAAGSRSCWQATEDGTISKWPKNFGDYDVTFRWCATDGRVDRFIVDKAYVVSGQPRHTIDVQPFRPGDFGRESYDFYIDVAVGAWVGSTTITNHGVTLTVPSGEYRDFWDISLHGDGRITGTKYKRR
jgi:hypothetical protein